MDMAGVDRGTSRRSSSSRQPDLLQAAKSLGEIREDFRGHLAAPAPSAQDTGERQQCGRFWAHLLENFEREALFELHSSRSEDGADGFCRSALSADHFAEIGRVNAELKYGNLFTLYSANLHLFRIIHERLRDGFNQFLHEPSAIRRYQQSAGVFACACLVDSGRRIPIAGTFYLEMRDRA